MTTTTSNKSERINLRLSHSLKRMLERAASIEGKTLSSFILGSALLRAEEIIRGHDVTTLNAEDSRIFLDALTKPVQFNDALTAALEEHDRTFNSK